MPLALDIDREALASFCRRSRIAKLELFGSRAKGTERPDSDVDLLVTFEDGYTPGLEFFGMADELEIILGRRVDLLTRPRVERDTNPSFKQSVLSVAEPLHVA
jgi:predicted nucleotidyltransferase